jgi:hypothetical protein
MHLVNLIPSIFPAYLPGYFLRNFFKSGLSASIVMVITLIFVPTIPARVNPVGA